MCFSGMLFNSMVTLNDLIKEVSKGDIGVIWTCINTYPWICILTSREDGLFESKSWLIFHVFIFGPNLWSQTFHKETIGARREERKAVDIIVRLEWGWHYCISLVCKFSFLSNHNFNSIIHVLDKLSFTSAKSSLVRNIKDWLCWLSVFSMNSSDLNKELVSYFLECLLLLAQER